MTPVDLRRLLLLATVWGGSFIFIRIAAPVLGPVVTVETRVLVAGLALLLYARLRGASLQLRPRWTQYLIMGALTSAIPFLLIATAELHLTASMAVILNATSPLFGAVIAAIWLKDPLTIRKLTGIGIAIGGVAVLVGWSPLTFDKTTLLSIGASLLAAFFYGLSGTYTKAKVKNAPPLGMATGSQLGASLLVAPVVPFALPHTHPSPSVLLCILTLALLSTAFAYILFFRLIVDVGPTRALTVTFLTPIFGVLWAALFLGEAITFGKLFACAVILAGTSLITGATVPFRTAPRRRAV